MSYKNTTLPPLRSGYAESSQRRMGRRMEQYRRFIGTPTKGKLTQTLQECLHDIYAKRPADPLLALTLRLQSKIDARSIDGSKKSQHKIALDEVARLSDENHRLRLLLGPERMDMAEQMELIQFQVKSANATIIRLENTKEALEGEIVKLKHQLADSRAVIDAKNKEIETFARSLNRLYGVEATSAAIKIQAIQRGINVRENADNSDDSDASDDSDDSDSEGDDDQVGGNSNESLAEERKFHSGIKNRRANFRRKRSIASKIGHQARSKARNRNRSSLNCQGVTENKEEIHSLFEENKHHDLNELESFLEGVDLDDAVEAATKIQAISRGRRSRSAAAAENDSNADDDDDDDDDDLCVLKEYLKDLDTEDVEKAVLKIQSLARGRFTRNQMQDVSLEKKLGPDVQALEDFLENQDDHKILHSASKIQSHFRARKARRHVHEKRRQHNAAIKIQKVARGRRGRRRLGVKRAESAAKNVSKTYIGPGVEEFQSFLDEQDDEEVEKAATKIEAAIRGRATRRENF